MYTSHRSTARITICVDPMGRHFLAFSSSSKASSLQPSSIAHKAQSTIGHLHYLFLLSSYGSYVPTRLELTHNHSLSSSGLLIWIARGLKKIFNPHTQSHLHQKNTSIANHSDCFLVLKNPFPVDTYTIKVMRFHFSLFLLLQPTAAWITTTATTTTILPKSHSETRLFSESAVTASSSSTAATASLTLDLVSKLRYRELRDELSQRQLPHDGTTTQLRDRLRKAAIVECNLTETGELDDNCKVRLLREKQ